MEQVSVKRKRGTLFIFFLRKTHKLIERFGSAAKTEKEEENEEPEEKSNEKGKEKEEEDQPAPSKKARTASTSRLLSHLNDGKILASLS